MPLYQANTQEHWQSGWLPLAFVNAAIDSQSRVIMKIMVVDNDRIFAAFVSGTLKNRGHEVVSASDGLKAIELLDQSAYDVLFIDYIMPNIDGRSLCNLVNRKYAGNKPCLILMSAIAAEEWDEIGDIEADIYMAKVPLKQMKANIVWTIDHMEEARAKKKEGVVIGIENIHPREITRELLTSRHHLELMLNKLSEGVMEINGNGQVVFLNPAVTALFHLGSYDIIGTNFFDLFPAEERKRVIDLWESDERSVRKIDSAHPLQIDASLMTLEIIPLPGSGRRIPALAIFNDITQLKHAERNLRESNEFLTRILNSSFSTSILTTDLDRNILFWNTGAERLFGYRSDEVIGKKIDFLYPSEEERRQADMLRERICREKTEISTEIREIDKEGGEKWVKVNLSPIIDGAGNVIGIQGMGEDITRRKAFEKALQDSERRFRAIFESAQDAIFIKDLHQRYTYVNPAMEQMFHLSGDQFLGKTDREVFGRDDEVGSAEKEYTVLMGKGSEEEVILTLDHRKVHFHVKKVPLYNSENQISGICGIARDFTDQRQLEGRLRQALKMEAIGTLAGGIAHDFNNILTGLLGFTDLAVQQNNDDPVMDNYLRQVQQAGIRARDLVKQILTFARKSEPVVTPVYLKDVLAETIKFLRSAIPSTIDIRHRLDSDAFVVGDKTQLQEVIINLCTNAAHALEAEGGAIDIQLTDVCIEESGGDAYAEHSPGNFVEMAVVDTGVGIPEEIVNKIFEPYFTTKERGRGTGLGLAVVHGIVKNYGGDIQVTSDVGVGTTVRVMLPAYQKTETSETAPGGDPADIQANDERILLVDDEESITIVCRKMLEAHGYRVDTATRSMDAISMFKAEPDAFDLVITDMTMPQMSGDALSREILSLRPDMPIILCTGYSDVVSSESAREIGIRSVTMKPFESGELARLVRRVLDEAASKDMHAGS